MYSSFVNLCASSIKLEEYTIPQIDLNILDSAKKQLLSLQEKEQLKENTEEEVTEPEEKVIEELEEEQCGVIIGENVELVSYLKFREKKMKLGVGIRLLDGMIMAYEIPLAPNAEVAGEVGKRMLMWNSDLIFSGERDIIVNNNTVLCPDATIRPPPPQAGKEPDSSGWSYPTIVVEVGSTEGLSSLHALARQYFSSRTTIKIYLAIKIFSCRDNGTRALVAFLYQRNSANPNRPVIVKSFGTAPIHSSALNFFQRLVPNQTITGFGLSSTPPCNHAGIPIYQINIPAAEIFKDSTDIIPANAENGFDLDLYYLQRIALAY